METKKDKDSVGNIDEMVEYCPGSEILPVKLTDTDRLERADRIAKAQEEVERLEMEKKAKTEEFKADISENAGVISACARQLRKGTQDILVDVETTRNFRTGTVRKVRLDTGEVLMERAMTESERQLSMKTVMQDTPPHEGT